MSDVWKNLEGQIVGQTYELKKFLALTGHSAVYLTQYGSDARKAVIKFISTDFPGPEQQLDRWLVASSLRHPNLLQVLDSGRTRLAQMDLLYVVMECADEDLFQIVPQRSLSQEEVQEILPSLLDAIRYLHTNAFIHGHISPSNIMAVGDRLKISGDAIVPIGKPRIAYRDRDGYDAPESESSPVAASADMWSLGATLVEILTQQPPLPLSNGVVDPKIPDSLPEPFLDIARHTWICDADARWSASRVSTRLNPMAAAAAAATVSAAIPAPSPALASVAPPADKPVAPVLPPLSVPLSTEPPVPVAKLQTPKVDQSRRQELPRPAQAVVLPNYVLPLLAGVLVLVAIYALPKILRHRDVASNSEVSAAPPIAQESTKPQVLQSSPAPQISEKPEVAPSRPSAQPVAKPAPEKPVPDESARASAPNSAPAVLRSSERSPALEAKPSRVVSGKGEVLDQVLPQASAKALSTIRGTVRINVRAAVDAAGAVTNAQLDAPGPSKYFAGLAENAARKWTFSPPEVDQRSVPSEWLIRFEFTQDGARAIPLQITP
jgi:serine/threonine protein kinase